MADIYFGSPFVNHKRILNVEKQKELQNIFPYIVNISQSKNNSIILKLNLIKHSNLYSDIINLPSDINKLIREFDTEHIYYELIMIPGRNYPYNCHHWYLKKNNSISDRRNIIYLSIKYENDGLERVWSPIWSPSTGIISMLSRIQDNLSKSINKKPIKNKVNIEKRMI